MRFSLSLPQLVDPDHRDPYWQSFELARLAESYGFESATIGHHHFIPGNISDPLMFMGAVAVRTETLRVGTGIFLLAVHHPVKVAEQVALLDVLSGGRAVFGVGSGWAAQEFEVFGSSVHERGARMEESLRALDLLWTRENVTFDGRFHTFGPLTLHPRPVQRPRVPLWVAGVAPVAVERAARLGDAWICGPVQSLTQARNCLATYRQACGRLGKPAEWVLRRYAWITDDPQQLRERILPAYVDELVAHWRESAEGDEERELVARLDRGEPVTTEEIAADRLLYGTPDDFVAQIERYRAATGVEHLHLAFGAGLPSSSAVGFRGTFAEHARMLELFGTEVVPRFR